MSAAPTVVIVGATGAVGEDLRRIIDARGLPVGEIRLAASERSVGRRVGFRSEEVELTRLAPELFDGADVAFFSAGGGVSREWAPVAAGRGAVVVDNSSAWRMHERVPLVDADVNPQAALDHPAGIVANPNCTTLTITPALAVLDALAGLTAITPTSFQAAGGSGQAGMDELTEQAAKLAGDREALRVGGKPLPEGSAFPHPIAFNVIPQCMGFTESGYTIEELKLRDEPRKILGLPSLVSHPTCVRVPVVVGHSVSVRAVCERPVDVAAFRSALQAAPGVTVLDDPEAGVYPTPLELVGTDGTFVGRIRPDLGDERAVMFWAVADNLRKGAALNAVQIGEVLLRGRA